MVDEDKAKGQAKQTKGEWKDKWGEATDDEDVQASGTKDKVVGKAQEAYGKAKDKAEEAYGKAKSKAEEEKDKSADDQNTRVSNDDLKESAQEAKDKAQDVFGKVKERARDEFNKRKK